jgi:hypothetical protein
MKNGLVIENSDNFWYKDDLLHREDGPAAEYLDGDKCWYKEGKLHRIGYPAIEWNNGDKEWYVEGKLHREDGPAIDWRNGVKLWIYQDENMECSSTEEFLKLIKLKAFW